MTRSEQIKAIRANTGLSQKKFAEKTGVPARTILSWETGGRKPPSYVIPLLKLAVRALDDIAKDPSQDGSFTTEFLQD